jgi:hypothetical protein
MAHTVAYHDRDTGSSIFSFLKWLIIAGKWRGNMDKAVRVVFGKPVLQVEPVVCGRRRNGLVDYGQDDGLCSEGRSEDTYH